MGLFDGILLREKKGSKDALQLFTSNPAYTQIPINLNGTKILKKNPSAAEIAAGVINITNWLVVRITPSAANLTRYFNADATKLCTVFGGQENVIAVHPDTTIITITGVDANVSIEGM